MKGKINVSAGLVYLLLAIGIYFLVSKAIEGFKSSALATISSSAANYVQVLGPTILKTAEAKNLPQYGFCLRQNQCGGGLKCKNATGIPIDNPVINSAVLNKLTYGTCS